MSLRRWDMGIQFLYPTELKNERKKAGLTQKEAASRIGISRSYYSDIENGRTLPSGGILFKINDILPIFLLLNDADRVQYEREG